MIKLLVRADDVGYSEGVNYGIAKSVKEGIAGSVGVMPNMPAAAHGLELLKETRVCLGQHTNICIGRPLSPPSRIPSLIQPNGEFKSSREYRQAPEDFVVLDEVILEIEAQYHRFLELVGEPPRYLDGHAVFSPNFLKGLEIVADKYGLKYSGIPLDGRTVKIGSKEVQFHMDWAKPNEDLLESFKATLQTEQKSGYHLLVFHPGYLDGEVLRSSSLTLSRPMEVDLLCDPKTKAWVHDSGIELITYDDL